MKSGAHLVERPRFRKIDETNIADHYHLTPEDVCYFLHEYTSGRDYSFSQTNSLISNLKKKPSQRGKSGYIYKQRAMTACSLALGQQIKPEWLKTGTLVPVPPSKAKDHPDYDDRMGIICRNFARGMGLKADVRELVIQNTSLVAAHESDEGQRPTVEDLLNVWEINDAVADPTPTDIAVVDDVLTAGTHFTAMKIMLQRRFPNASVVGVFMARRVFPA